MCCKLVCPNKIIFFLSTFCFSRMTPFWFTASRSFFPPMTHCSFWGKKSILLYFLFGPSILNQNKKSWILALVQPLIIQYWTNPLPSLQLIFLIREMGILLISYPLAQDFSKKTTRYTGKEFQSQNAMYKQVNSILSQASRVTGKEYRHEVNIKSYIQVTTTLHRFIESKAVLYYPLSCKAQLVSLCLLKANLEQDLRLLAWLIYSTVLDHCFSLECTHSGCV